MLRRSILTIGLLVSIWTVPVLAQGQSECACSIGGPNGCSASQTCTPGYEAKCTCTASGCSSTCTKVGGADENYRIVDNNALIKTLKTSDSKTIGSILSQTFYNNIEFEPSAKDFVFNYKKVDPASHWEILEFLAGRGNVKINGHTLEFWQNMRDSLLKGGELNICVGETSVARVLSHVSFITGKKFTIIDGNSNNRIRGSIQGKNLDEFMQNLNKLGQVTILEN